MVLIKLLRDIHTGFDLANNPIFLTKGQTHDVNEDFLQKWQSSHELIPLWETIAINETHQTPQKDENKNNKKTTNSN